MLGRLVQLKTSYDMFCQVRPGYGILGRYAKLGQLKTGKVMLGPVGSCFVRLVEVRPG